MQKAGNPKPLQILAADLTISLPLRQTLADLSLSLRPRQNGEMRDAAGGLPAMPFESRNAANSIVRLSAIATWMLGEPMGKNENEERSHNVN